MSFADTLNGYKIEYRENEPMSFHSTMKVGGKAKYFVMPKDVEELKTAVFLAKRDGENFTVLGNGSNTVFSDDGYNGAVISTEKMCNITVCDGKMIAQAGALLSKCASMAAAASLSGMEFAAGIPGTAGGAVFMNAGAYGGEMKDIVKSVTCLKDGVLVSIKGSDCGFGYRRSIFSENGGIIVSVELSLTDGDISEITAKMKELSEKRREKQPLDKPSCGSAFKRPDGYFAGKLIEDAGLKGYSVGKMAVSEKHAGFIVNLGGGTEKELEKLIDDIREKVRANSGVTLEPEIRIIKDVKEGKRS